MTIRPFQSSHVVGALLLLLVVSCAGLRYYDIDIEVFPDPRDAYLRLAGRALGFLSSHNVADADIRQRGQELVIQREIVTTEVSWFKVRTQHVCQRFVISVGATQLRSVGGEEAWGSRVSSWVETEDGSCNSEGRLIRYPPDSVSRGLYGEVLKGIKEMEH